MNSLLLSILANLSADLLLQSRKIASAKDNLKPTAIVLHGVMVFGAILFFLHGYQWPTLIGYAAVMTGIHLAIDLFKGLISRIRNPGLNLLAIIMDQILHVITVIVIWTWFDLQANQEIMSFYERIFRVNALVSFTGIADSAVKFIPERFLLGVIVYLYVCLGGSTLIDKFLLWLRQKEEVFGDQTYRTGKWIGILERLIVLSLILNNALGSVAFILTAKSIARFNELSNRDFAEYYLIGTLSSTMLAIGGGFVFNYLLTLV
ncbi:MAG: DUF3307 domain-containing protein [Bacteroidota bacterium]